MTRFFYLLASLILILNRFAFATEDPLLHAKRLINANPRLSFCDSSAEQGSKASVSNRDYPIITLDSFKANIIKARIVAQLNSAVQSLASVPALQAVPNLNLKQFSPFPVIPSTASVQYLAFYPKKYDKNEVRLAVIIAIRFISPDEAVAYAKAAAPSEKQFSPSRSIIYIRDNTLYIWYDSRSNSTYYQADGDVNSVKVAILSELGVPMSY